MKYPFLPKSNRHLKAGQFWPVPLADGRYACGRVIDVMPPEETDLHVPNLGTRSFLAGLMDWVGENPPADRDLEGALLIDQGVAHIGAIAVGGSCILGERPLQADGISPLLWVTPMSLGDRTRYLYQGFRRVREADPTECTPYFGLSAWSKPYLQARANLRFVDGQLPADDYQTYAPFGPDSA
ncbi:hypothetical protein ACFCV9_28480 [Streptomyces sp. NPDC056367]|uniref:hypothetical protein n=1 Tax=Streptomyces sp. NPDC056367 TaxID=3345797 RepID=UPI0035DD37D1